MNWKLIGGVFIIVIGLFVYFAYTFVKSVEGFSEMYADDPCSSYKGIEVEISLDTVLIDKYIDIPNGKFAFANLQDSLPPKMIKLNSKNKVLWTRAFPDSVCWIPHNKISINRLYEDEYGLKIDCFNDSYSEPITIFLDENYDFKDMYISPM